jgi:CheY-like chemotaxis protein/HPt (histidine-containing phosphotransfer) domain-containing protein/anti-sigma regulatory factor (Ser/Thr protein kinase)
LLTLINDILDFSKIEAGKLVLEEIDLDLQTLLEDTLGLFAHTAYSKNLELWFRFPLVLTTMLRGDSNRLRQILSNLLNNAIKFTETGHVTLSVSYSEENQGASSNIILFYIEIIDTGIGISDVHRIQLFQPFSQADSSTTRRFGGTGLGLVIVQRLIKMMGGEIGVCSEEGKGSRFWLHLPLKKSTMQLKATYSATQMQKLQQLKVVVVSQDDNLLTILQEQLQIWGVQVITATTLHAMQQQLQLLDKKPAVMLLDALLLAHHARPIAQLHDELIQRGWKVAIINHWNNAANTSEVGHCWINKPITPAKLLECLLVLCGEVTKSIRPAAKTDIDTMATLQWQTQRVLLAEDNVINQEVICEMLRQLGCQTTVVNNGKQALERLKQSDFDLIFMDCHMPELDGFGATQAIRALEQGTTKHIPIVALTADAMQDNRESCFVSGMDDYLAKPMKIQDLRNVLSRYLPSDSAEIDPLPAPAAPAVKHETNTTAVLSTSALASLRTQMKGRGVNWLIDLYLKELPNYIQDLQHAVEIGDGHQVYLAAHKFKGSCANLGLTRLTHLCQKLEELGKQGNVVTATQLVNEILPAEREQAITALQLQKPLD